VTASLTGTRPLTRLAVRRSVGMLSAWIYLVTILMVVSARSVQKLYPTAAGLDRFTANASHNPALDFLYGPVFSHSAGGVIAWKPGGFAAVAAGLMSIFLVVRHTRADEESGRLELVSATPVGRRAPLAAALLVAVVANAVLAALMAAALIAINHLPAAGTLAFALSVGACGLAFAGLAAVTAQVASSSRGARELAIGALALAYLLRAFGDSAGAGGPHWLTWISPLGWNEQVRPYAADRWWLLAAEAALALAVTAAAWVLTARRDYGAGLLPARAGRPQAGRLLRGPFGLAWTLQRGSLVGWAIGFVALGLATGSIAPSVGTLVGGSLQVRHGIQRLGGSAGLTSAYLAAVMSIAGLIAAAYATSAVLRLRAEETSERAEPVLASAVGRIRWALSHLLVAAAGSAVLLACAGAGAGVGYGLHGGDFGGRLASLLGAALAQLPAVLAVAGVAVVAFGLRPDWSVRGLRPDWTIAISWSAVGLAALIVLFGPLFSLPQWAMDISPFTHLPRLPGTPLTAAPLVWLSLAALALAAAGLAGLRRRDLD
jgi:ABC-2 type transport system permease protein